MSVPVRIQRRRTKGWRMPEGAVYVGRPSPWGNPYRYDRPIDWMDMELYRRWVTGEEHRADPLFIRAMGLPPTPPDITRLRTATALACWCPLDQPCHADVLIKLLAEAA